MSGYTADNGLVISEAELRQMQREKMTMLSPDEQALREMADWAAEGARAFLVRRYHEHEWRVTVGVHRA